MCSFFSFVGDGYGNYKYIDWSLREQWLKNKSGNMPDSHTRILTQFSVPPKMQDRWSKYEYNPITKLFSVDQGVEGHDHEAAKAWVETLDFKTVIPALIIKEIKNPLDKARKPTKKDSALLNQWNSVRSSVRDSVRDSVWNSVRSSVGESVRDSVRDSVGDSVGDSVWDSVGDSVRASVWDSVRASVRASMGDSVWASVWDSVRASMGDSVWAYIGTFFDIQYTHDFSSCTTLWERGFVPSYDGATWRLHTGKHANIVYETRLV